MRLTIVSREFKFECFLYKYEFIKFSAINAVILVEKPHEGFKYYETADI